MLNFFSKIFKAMSELDYVASHFKQWTSPPSYWIIKQTYKLDSLLMFFCWLGHRKMYFFYIPLIHPKNRAWRWYTSCYVTLWSVWWPHHFKLNWSLLCFFSQRNGKWSTNLTINDTVVDGTLTTGQFLRHLVVI